MTILGPIGYIMYNNSPRSRPHGKEQTTMRHHSIITARTEGAVEAWLRLGWHVIGHAWDHAGPFTVLALYVGRA